MPAPFRLQHYFSFAGHSGMFGKLDLFSGQLTLQEEVKHASGCPGPPSYSHTVLSKPLRVPKLLRAAVALVPGAKANVKTLLRGLFWWRSG